MKGRLRLAGALVGVPASAYFAVFAYRTVTRHDLHSLCTTPMIAAISAAALASAAVIPTSSWAWGRLLRGTGVGLPILELNLIMGLTQIGKYLPGSVAQHLGRTAMSIERGVPASTLFLTLVVEVLLTMVASLAVGVAGFVASVRTAGQLPVGHLQTAALAGLCLVIALVGLGVASRSTPLLSRAWIPRLPGTPGPGARASSTAFAVYVLNFALLGAGLYGVALAASGVGPAELPFFIGVLAMSWIAGFVAPGAPAGLGVREGVMAVLLTPRIDSARALEIIIAFRVATTLGDLLGFAWGGALLLLKQRRPSGSVPA
ncbi:MAG TPA: lysylphosphatidylglycerol synthase domain-containing protein [Vicinamibacteria bacterium]|nr:lysylphosphatidylglycerol synthase domain-containing protein [Vicinamibacteria bacterium]